ncbi:MAG: hypothetical protein ABIG84_08115 [archaeon]
MMEMIEQDPAKRINKNIELILNHATLIGNHNPKTEPKYRNDIKQTESGLPELLKISRHQNTSKRPLPLSNQKNPLELKGLAITDHLKETIDTHHGLHNPIELIRKQTRI